MRYILLTGGLGNQLFCLLRALTLALESNPGISNISTDIRYTSSIALIDPSGYKNSVRPVELPNLLPSVSSLIIKPNRFYMSCIYSLLGFSRLLRHFSTKSYRHISYSPIPLYNFSLPGNGIEFGYFNFLSRDPFILKALFIIKQIIQNDLPPQRNEIAVHVRRGDYISHNMPIVSVKSYIQSISRMPSDYPISVYTDDLHHSDIKLILSLLGSRASLTKQQSSLDDFKSIASSSHLVGSNSSFSLWAHLASLNQTAVFPRLWANPNIFANNCFGDLLEYY